MPAAELEFLFTFPSKSVRRTRKFVVAFLRSGEGYCVPLFVLVILARARRLESAAKVLTLVSGRDVKTDELGGTFRRRERSLLGTLSVALPLGPGSPKCL